MKHTKGYTLILALAMVASLCTIAAAKKRESGNKGGAGTDPAAQDAAAVSNEIEEILKKYKDIVMVGSMIVSIPLTFFGYRLVNAVLFLAGATASGYGSYLLSDHLISPEYQSKAGVLIAVSVVLAVAGGLVSAKLRKFGVFLAGAAGGVVGAFALNAALLSHLPTLFDSIPQLYLYIFCVAFGLIAGALALKLERMILEMATAASGAAALVYATKYFVEKSHSVTTWGDSMVWVYLGSWLCLFLVGFAVQHLITSQKAHTNKVRRKSLLAYEINATGHIQTNDYKTIVIEHKSGGAPLAKHVINSV